MDDEHIREMWIASASVIHGWPAGAQPKRTHDGRFECDWHEQEYQVFKAGHQTKRMGRPVGTGAPPDQQRKPRSVRLNDERWSKLQRLGAGWLEAAIDRAREPK